MALPSHIVSKSKTRSIFQRADVQRTLHLRLNAEHQAIDAGWREHEGSVKLTVRGKPGLPYLTRRYLLSTCWVRVSSLVASAAACVELVGSATLIRWVVASARKKKKILQRRNAYCKCPLNSFSASYIDQPQCDGTGVLKFVPAV